MDETNARARAVERMFSSIAGKYDFLNHLLSLGMDIRWRKKAVLAFEEGLAGKAVLDLACGTGDLSIALARAGDGATRILGGDFSEEMLKIGGKKIARLGLDGAITLEKIDALSINQPDDQFDGVTCAFGVRNFAILDKGLAEMVRVTKPGGRVVVLEFTTPANWFFAAVYRLYFTRILPIIGGLVSGNRGAYEYLPDTVYKFPAPPELSAKLSELGLENVGFTPLTFGICGVHTGVKKASDG